MKALVKNINEKGIWLKDVAKPTIRHSTLHSTQGGRAGTENGGAYVKDYNDKEIWTSDYLIKIVGFEFFCNFDLIL